MATYNYSSYNSIIYDIIDEIDDNDITKKISPESIKGYILQGCQRIASKVPIVQQMDLRLVIEQTEYDFADTTTPVTGTGTVGVGANKTVTGVTATGTGTITTSDTAVTGSSTLFLTELAIGKMIIVGTEKKMVTVITSATSCTIDTGFDTDLTASAFDYSTTKFTKEINEGSSIIIGGVTHIVDTITDGYNLTVTQAYTAAQSAQTFTVDTMVTEIPTKFYDLTKYADRLEGTVPRKVRIVSNDKLLKQNRMDYGVNSYSDYDQPLMASVWRNASGRNYLKIYPPVTTDKQMTLYGFVQINPRFYASDALTANIPIQQQYEPAIKEFAKYMIYKRVKDRENWETAWNMFNTYVNELLVNLPVKPEIAIEYY